MPLSQVYNTDCLEYMRTLPDNYFQLAIADPPYGDANTGKQNPHVDLGSRSRKYLKDTDITPPIKIQQIRWTIPEVYLGRAGHGRPSTEKNLSVGHGPR